MRLKAAAGIEMYDVPIVYSNSTVAEELEERGKTWKYMEMPFASSISTLIEVLN